MNVDDEITRAGAAEGGETLARLIARYGGRVPRYTSYPTAVQFSAAVGAGDYRRWLASLTRAQGPLSIYLHIPFCAKLCWYCGCHTKVANGPQPVADYVSDLLAEIDLVAAQLSERLVVGAIHFGGGTPNMLAPDALERILARLAARFDLKADADIAVEIDPRLMTPEWAKVAAQNGVRRASLGVQDFCPDVQAAINRLQPYETVEAAVAMLRGAGVAAINLDLVYGLPRQNLKRLKTTVHQALQLHPDRLSLFGYAHVPWLKPHQKLIADAELPDARLRLLMQRQAARQLGTAGYRRLGLDHFARREDALAEAAAAHEMRRNFQGYTNDAAEVLIGFGASAIGRLPQGYVQNTAATGEWGGRIETGALPVARGVAFSDEDRFRAAIIERLMCDFEVDLAALAAAHSRSLEELEAEREELAAMEMDGLVGLSGPVVRVSEDGRDFVRSVCAVFDQYLERGGVRHAQAI